MWYFCVVLLNWAYTCNLRAFILLPALTRPIDSDQDVLDFASVAYLPVTEYMYPIVSKDRSL